jgi:vacuolar-type H+-ATPase subunit E/Vma4
MTENQGNPPEAAIIEQITGDAEAQARKLIGNAEMSVTAEAKKTEREIAGFEEDLRAGWEARVEKIQTREVSTARIESRRLLLKARELAVAGVFDEIKAGLGHLRENPGRYRESLGNLAVEAVEAVGGDEAVLRISERDRGFADDAFAQDVRERLGTAAGGPSFRVEFDSGDNGGGCKATSADGRIVFDNTYGRRLERLRREIRAMIVGELDKINE